MAHRRVKRWTGGGSPTFAEELERHALVEEAVGETRAVIEASNAAAIEHARLHLRVISCWDCTAPKGCCSMHTGAYLHEGVAIAAHLIDEGRDTAELRVALGEAALAMETEAEAEYRRPCVFLGAGERCTVYDVRPSVCGAHLVISAPAVCSDPVIANESALVGELHRERPREHAEQFVARMGLPSLDVPYRGALPRMVLVALEAWERRDYVTFIATQLRAAVHRYAWAIR